jgi:hypothetical protein
MTRGKGSLFVATRTGISVLGLRAAGSPAPTWWAHHCGCAWVAAWLMLRGHQFLGDRELLDDQGWSGEISWRDHKGVHVSRHRPDLIALASTGGRFAVEVELAQKSIERLRAIITMHASWRSADATGGVIYVCRDQDGHERVNRVAEQTGLIATEGRGLRIELLARPVCPAESSATRCTCRRTPSHPTPASCTATWARLASRRGHARGRVRPACAERITRVIIRFCGPRPGDPEACCEAMSPPRYRLVIDGAPDNGAPSRSTRWRSAPAAVGRKSSGRFGDPMHLQGLLERIHSLGLTLHGLTPLEAETSVTGSRTHSRSQRPSSGTTTKGP